MTFGSVFAGIGGFDLGLERAGMTCKWQVEIDDYANKVLEKHWPNVPRFKDVRTFPPRPESPWLGANLRELAVDVLCGGFPCQDISLAKMDGAGIDGDRSGLWFEYERIIGILRPKIVVVENTPGLFVRGIDAVLGGLAALGFDAEWSIVSACGMGAPHTRERLFILAYAGPMGRDEGGGIAGHEKGKRQRWRESAGKNQSSSGRACHWTVEPAVVRVAHGVPARVDRIAGLGNAVVPQVAEWIGRRIMEAA